jgi:hypothetical protein
VFGVHIKGGMYTGEFENGVLRKIFGPKRKM